MIVKAIFSAVGLGSFLWILKGYGLEKIVSDTSSLGWWFIPLMLSFLPVAAIYGLAWRLVTPNFPKGRFCLFLKFSIISVAWNNLSPFVKMMGEPVRVLLLEPTIGRASAIESAVLYNLVHILGTLLAFVLGAAFLLFLYPVGHTVRIVFLSIIVITLCLVLLVFFLPKLGKKISKSTGKGLARKVRFWLRWSLAKMRIFSKRYAWRFWTAVGLEVAVRFVEGLVFWTAFKALGQEISFFESALLDVGRALLDNAFFFIPYQVGSREAGILLLSDEVMKLTTASVVSAALFYRLMELFWMAMGYLWWTKELSSRKSVK